MKLMTYNILNGGEAGLPLVEKVIKKENPDYLTINEANTFAKDNNKILKKFSKNLNYPYYDIALSGEYDYHLVILSKYPFKKIYKIKPLMRAGIITIIQTEIGKISMISTHLTPYTEDLRLPEIDLIIEGQKRYKNKILMGDMNSLSPYDNYKSEIIKNFNEMQLKKFTTNGKLRFDAIKKILSNDYLDTALELGKNKEYTAPTSLNEYEAHSNMRLDYVFISRSLRKYLKSYLVIKNELTNKASDHFPVSITLE